MSISHLFNEDCELHKEYRKTKNMSIQNLINVQILCTDRKK